MTGMKSRRIGRRRVLAILLWTCLLALPAHAHVGSPTVFFEGLAGAYPVRIVIRPPEVIPGLADISVRIGTNGIRRVSALPMRWNTGRAGAPRPDEAIPVRGETNLFSTQLWFMQGGAQSVEVQIEGAGGAGSVIVPVNAVASRVLGMPRGLGAILVLLGTVLLLLMAAIIGAAVRESVLPQGQFPSARRRWAARGAMLAAASGLLVLLGLGRKWWASEASAYFNNRLYQPLSTRVAVAQSESIHQLELQVMDQRFEKGGPIVPDHGKLMHLFIVREPGLDVFGHLHPEKVDWRTFRAALPALPAGRYGVYADITYETGFADTLVSELMLDQPLEEEAGSPNDAGRDPDDAWCFSPFLTGANQPVELNGAGSGQIVVERMNQESCVAQRETSLQFRVHFANGTPVALEPYLGMSGHLVLRNAEGTVFTHLHPGGTFSMAAQQLFELRAAGKAPMKVSSAQDDPLCRLPDSDELAALWRENSARGSAPTLSFPYAFPKPGSYRLWLQFKVGGGIMTRVFDVRVDGTGKGS